MSSVLDRYIFKIVFNTVMTMLFMLVSLSGIIKFIDELRKVGQGKYSTFSAGFYTLLSIPKDIETFFPMAALLGVLFGLGMLSTRSELIVMQASGFSQLQVSASVLKTSIALVLLTMSIGEWVAPIGEKIARHYRTQMIDDGSSMSSLQKGLWAKDGNDFIFIERVVGNYKLSGVNIYHFDQKEQLRTLRHASSAIFIDGDWKLFQVDESDLRDIKKITHKQTMNDVWETTLTPKKLWLITLEPSSLSISGLYHYIKYFERNGQNLSRYRLHMWRKIFSPLSLSVMMLMALTFVFGPLRSVSVGVRLVTGMSISFLFYVLDRIFGSLSLIYNISPILGVLLPNLTCLGISIGVFLLRRN